MEGIKREIALWVGMAEQRMLEKKAQRNETVIVGTPDGEIKAIPARRLLRKAKQRKMK